MEQLLAQIRLGSQAAFAELMQEWYPRVYQYAWKYFAGKHRHGQVHDVAEEVAQKTFITVHQKLDKLREPARFKGWLFRIATNLCYEEDRKKKKWETRLSTNSESEDEAWRTPSGEAGPFQKAVQSEISYWVLKALDQLSPEQRSVLILKEYQGLKFREIAEALGISENTAKSRLYYGLQHMRMFLERKHITQENLRYDV
ncbi:MAG: RNA polymerase sigma factor [Bacteroidota bacterium]